MSLAVKAFKPVKIITPETDLNKDLYFGVLKGANRVSYRANKSQSVSNNVTVTFSANPPSPTTLVSRNVDLRMLTRISITADVPVGQKLWQSGYISLRQYPLATLMQTLEISLNNVSFSQNISQTTKHLLLFHGQEYDIDQLYNGKSPSHRDMSIDYDMLSGDIMNNPLGSFENSTLNSILPRGAFPIRAFSNPVSAGSPVTAVLDVELTEPLWLSPFVFSKKYYNCTSMVGIQTLSATITWASNLSRILSISPDIPASNITVAVSFLDAALDFRYLTPSLEPIPRSLSMNFFNVQRYVTSYSGTITSLDSVRISSNNIQLNTIPSYMYLFVKKNTNSETFNDTDSYYAIENISVQWENQNSLLSSASKVQLYNMSQSNGCKLSYPEWSGEPMYSSVGSTDKKIIGVGTLIALQFGKDIALPDPWEAPGASTGTYQLQVDVECKNFTDSSISNLDFYIITSTGGVFTIDNNYAYKVIGPATKENVLSAKEMKEVSYDSLEAMSGSGSKFLKKLGKQALKVGVKKGLPAAIKIGEKAASRALGSALVGGRKYQGSPLVGGQLIDRSELDYY